MQFLCLAGIKTNMISTGNDEKQSQYDLEGIQRNLLMLAKEAGQMILAAVPAANDNTTKANSSDIVTITDKAVEDMVMKRLKVEYPAYEFYGEESYVPGQLLSNEPTFVVDPVDGTTNFVHGYPFTCISLAFVAEKVPLVGVVYNPFLDQLYSAIKGQGSFRSSCGGNVKEKLPLRNPEPLVSLMTCLVGVEWGSDRKESNFENKSRIYKKLTQCLEEGGSMVHSLRSIGSAALQMCFVATGQQDIYWEAGCWAWDVAAAACILHEAGGKLYSGVPGNETCELDSRNYLAVRAGEGQRKVVEEIWQVIGPEPLLYGQ